LQEVIELSLAYHVAAAGQGQPGHEEARRLLRRAVAARRKLADTEEALGRLAAGSFGGCEQCRSPIPAPQLLAVPEARYCQACTTGPGTKRQQTALAPGRR
jgi:RNA polymerase-binding transcription factor DksA